MGNNQSMLDHVTNGTAFDDQEFKGMLRDLLQTNPFAFGDEIFPDDDEIFKDPPTVVTRNVRRRAPDQDGEFLLAPNRSRIPFLMKLKYLERDFVYLLIYSKDLLLKVNKLISLKMCTLPR